MSPSLIKEAFLKTKKENRPALITFTVAGDNSKNKSLEILKSISQYADICELGFPHNAPIGDGDQIQTSSHRAIKNGIKISDVFSIAKKFKEIKKTKPIILMGYYNIIYQYGENNFLNDCNKSKVDGLIIVDLPFPENIKFANKCKKKKINFIQLISPLTSHLRLKHIIKHSHDMISHLRLKHIIKHSHDMIYYISMLSTTGGKLKISSKKILERYSKIKNLSKLKKVVIGFGITEKTIESLKKADGLVVGSAICKEITDSIKKRQNIVTNVMNVVKRLKNKIK